LAFAVLGALLSGARARAEDAAEPEPATSEPVVVRPSLFLSGPFYNPLEADNWQANFQSTYIWQKKAAMAAAYTGPHSLTTEAETGYTLTATLSLGFRPWTKAEVFFNPEIIQSAELSQLHGLGGLSNGENQKSGGPKAKLYQARLFLRQTISLSGESLAVDSAPNQFAGKVARRRFVITVGNLAMTDVFDCNSFSHDPRTQFINWAMWTYGASDYAADTRGYTWGGTIEYYHDDWAFRLGRFAQPKESNGLPIDFNIIEHYGDNLEIEHGHILGGQPGRVRLLAFDNRARMGNFRDALEYARNSGGTPAVSDVRRNQLKLGFGVGIEQNVTQDAGLFARFSYNDGQTETYAFTEIERSLSAGGNLKGRVWRRPADTLGLAFAVNGISAAHRDYLASGGLGAFIGDGQLVNYGLEQIAEAFYAARFFNGMWFTIDGQYIVNPAYNKDRGPVKILGVRLHVEL
jgi:high affinity Mn2+ porin